LEVIKTLDEILVIKESVPIYYYNRDPDITLSEDWYVLQSGFFMALSQFAHEMRSGRLRFIVLENRLYALDETSDMLLIFGNDKKMEQKVIQQLQKDIDKATDYLNSILTKFDMTDFQPTDPHLNEISKKFGAFLKEQKLVEDDIPFDPIESRSMMQKFIFKSIGYKPGQCNIGPAERYKRLLVGTIFLALGVVGALAMGLLGVNHWYSLALLPLFFLGFYGLYQYFFRFCVTNALTKRYDMR
jgi:hypothetical protein